MNNIVYKLGPMLQRQIEVYAQINASMDDVCLPSNIKEHGYILVQDFFPLCHGHNLTVKVTK